MAVGSCFALAAALLLLFSACEAATVAPAPEAPGPLNLTGILEKGGQYENFERLLKATQVGQQIESQLNNSFDGLTIFAPTDNAFNNLKPGTLNGLSSQEQVSLVLYHVLPRYYSPTTFQTTSNPVSTQASGENGVYTVNITASSSSSQLNVSTGVNQAPVSNHLYLDFPLAVYSVDSVLLPYQLFGPKPPAAAPSPLVKPKKATPRAADSAADVPSASADESTPAAATRVTSKAAAAAVALLAVLAVTIADLLQ
ncbi:fasciclin-like arabinogalactan protein 6 [Curcuma longa]|uniref:fasciclin-like arabinogalactan protein 6 n=1 Tax=Curcuma longa TaxID=136217 RepID=UPI003D9E2AF7